MIKFLFHTIIKIIYESLIIRHFIYLFIYNKNNKSIYLVLILLCMLYVELYKQIYILNIFLMSLSHKT